VAAGLRYWAFVLSLHDSARPASESSSDATGNVGETRRNLQPRANDEVRARKIARLAEQHELEEDHGRLGHGAQ
jgi:hypothetical protein